MSAGARDELAASARELDLAAAAPPFRYNPTAWRERVPICVLAVGAWLVAIVPSRASEPPAPWLRARRSP